MAGAGVGIHWHVREWGVGAGVKPAGAGGGPQPGWARLQPPSFLRQPPGFLRLWGPSWLQQEPAPIVCNERGSGIPLGPHSPAPWDPCHPGIALGLLPPRDPLGTKGPRSFSSRLPSLGPLTPREPQHPSSLQVPPPQHSESTDPATSRPPSTQGHQTPSPLGPPVPRHPSSFLLGSQLPFSSPKLYSLHPAPSTTVQPGGQADPIGWHSPGTGVMRCLLGGTSWWAGRRAGERTVGRESHWSIPAVCAHPCPLPASPPLRQGHLGAGLYLSGSSGHQRLPAPGASPCCRTGPGLWGPPRSCRGKDGGGGQVVAISGMEHEWGRRMNVRLGVHPILLDGIGVPPGITHLTSRSSRTFSGRSRMASSGRTKSSTLPSCRYCRRKRGVSRWVDPPCASVYLPELNVGK